MAPRKPKNSTETEVEIKLPDHLLTADRATQEAYIASVVGYDERQASFEVNYLEKDDYIGRPFDILKVDTRVGASMKGEDDWCLTVRDCEDATEGAFTFDKNRFRDVSMQNLADVVKRFGSAPYHTLQELPAQAGMSNPFAVVPMARWKTLEDIEAERAQKKRERRRGK